MWVEDDKAARASGHHSQSGSGHVMSVLMLVGAVAALSHCGGQPESSREILVGDGCAEGASDCRADSVCPEGSERIGEECRFPCISGWERDEAGHCQPPCPKGWSRVEGYCAEPCPAGMEAVGPLCRPPAASVGPAPAKDVPFDDEGSTGAEQVIYVHAGQGRQDGPGNSPDTAFDSLTEALKAIDVKAARVAIVIGPGDYSMGGGLTALLPGGWAGQERELGLFGLHADKTRILVEATPSSGLKLDATLARFELARVAVIGGKVEAAAVAHLAVIDCRLGGVPAGDSGPGLAGIVWNRPESGDGSVTIERSHFPDGSFAFQQLVASGRIGQGAVRNCWFERCSQKCLELRAFGSFEIEDNRFEGPGGKAVEILKPTGQDYQLGIRRNFIDAMAGGIELDDVNDAQLEDNSMRHLSVAPLSLSYCSFVGAAGTRILGQAEGKTGYFLHGIMIEDSQNIELQRTLVIGQEQHGIKINRSEHVELLGAVVTGCGENGIEVYGESRDITIADTLLTDNKKDGLKMKQGGAVTLERNLVANNGACGVRLEQVDALTVGQCELSGNGSTGIRLNSLTGGDEALYSVVGNRLHENGKVGILVRSGGPGEVELEGNRVVGTRPGTLLNVQGISTIGDGIAVVTGTDVGLDVATPTRVRAEKNEVTGNYRLGMVVDGQGTAAQVEDTLFGAGNGYGEALALTVGGVPHEGPVDLLLQGGAELIGSDSGLALQPDAPVSLGEGGDPGG